MSTFRRMCDFKSSCTGTRMCTYLIWLTRLRSFAEEPRSSSYVLKSSTGDLALSKPSCLGVDVLFIQTKRLKLGTQNQGIRCWSIEVLLNLDKWLCEAFIVRKIWYEAWHTTCASVLWYTTYLTRAQLTQAQPIF